MVGRIGFSFLPFWATLFAVVQPAVSPNPAAPLCWVFCLCPRQLVGPAGLCVQVLVRRCRCGPWQAIRQVISQSSSFLLGSRARGFVLGTQAAGGSSHFRLGTLASGLVLGTCAASWLWAWEARSRRSSCPGLESLGQARRPDTESRNTGVRGFGPVGGAASLCSRCSPTRGFRCGCPSRVSCVGPQFANLICVRATRPQVRAGTAYPVLAVQGRRGEGRQGLRLLPRVL